MTFLPRDPGGHEHHLVQLETGLYLARSHEMTMVNRVEGAAHDPESPAGHGRSLGEPFGVSSGGDKLDAQRA